METLFLAVQLVWAKVILEDNLVYFTSEWKQSFTGLPTSAPVVQLKKSGLFQFRLCSL
jgi:hypothetical protein